MNETETWDDKEDFPKGRKEISKERNDRNIKQWLLCLSLYFSQSSLSSSSSCSSTTWPREMKRNRRSCDIRWWLNSVLFINLRPGGKERSCRLRLKCCWWWWMSLTFISDSTSSSSTTTAPLSYQVEGAGGSRILSFTFRISPRVASVAWMAGICPSCANFRFLAVAQYIISVPKQWSRNVYTSHPLSSSCATATAPAHRCVPKTYNYAPDGNANVMETDPRGVRRIPNSQKSVFIILIIVPCKRTTKHFCKPTPWQADKRCKHAEPASGH